ncbi:Salutaridinol 7-O-acetyltransferase [Glycine soja]|uniref:Salutaridinol 7-O-acetyltransferase n=1 Tax=Glycine soja TaxID=3848 RepID=A0A445JTE4_GLYSO|nr:Salutaridinol 7-O-acetyltransferase [Glycine soja]
MTTLHQRRRRRRRKLLIEVWSGGARVRGGGGGGGVEHFAVRVEHYNSLTTLIDHLKSLVLNQDNFSIECNDEGANFVQAKLTVLHKFLPTDLVSEGSNSGTYVTSIQVNIFECGGIAIGICISHRILDGAALSTFIKGWTERAKASNCNQLTQPSFIASSLFPTNNNPWLRDLSMCTHGSLVTHLVNLRRRMDEALCPQHAMGNLLWLVAAENELVGKLRKSISQVDNKFVEELRGDKGRSIMKESLGAIGEKGSKGEVDLLGLVVGAILGMRLILGGESPLG